MGQAAGGARARTWTKTLFPSPNAPAEARWFFSSTVAGSEPLEDSETPVLLLSEVVSNAVRHGDPGRAIKLTLTRNAARLRVAVRNEGRFTPPRNRRSEPGGWGLVLIQQLATRWGIEVGEAAVETWFELDAV